MEGEMHATTLSFRAPEEFAEETRSFASMVGLKSSDYIREAVREKNERLMAERIGNLSRKLAAKHAAFNESTEESIADGLD
jgi:pantoate kinase